MFALAQSYPTRTPPPQIHRNLPLSYTYLLPLNPLNSSMQILVSPVRLTIRRGCRSLGTLQDFEVCLSSYNRMGDRFTLPYQVIVVYLVPVFFEPHWRIGATSIASERPAHPCLGNALTMILSACMHGDFMRHDMHGVGRMDYRVKSLRPRHHATPPREGPAAC